MGRISLRGWLTGFQVALVVVVAAGLVLAALFLFHRLAQEHGRTRVELAALASRQMLDRSAESASTSARLLAERPTLLRLAAAGEEERLAAFLEQFRATAGLDGCAVVRAARAATTSAPPLPWEALTVAGVERETGRTFLPAPPGERAPLLVAAAPLAAGREGIGDGSGLAGEVRVVRRLDEAFVARLAEQVGMRVRLLPSAAAADDAATEAGDLTARLPLGSEEAPVGWLEVVLPAAEVDAPVRRFTRTLLVFSLAATALALATGLGVGRRLARPLRLLERSARRIGGGDLATPVPAAAGAELGALAVTMEDMRRRLLALTAELRRREAEAQALLAGIVEGVFSVDAERRIRFFNPRAAAMLGIAPDEAVGRFCGDVLRPRPVDGELPCDARCPILHARSRGGSRAVEHLELPRGEQRTVVVTSAPPAGGSQVLVMRDETDLEAARRVRDAVLANVSHELKTPLSAQLASIELLRDGLGTLPPAAAAELLASLQRSTVRLTRLIDNLLASVRLEAGLPAPARRPVALGEVIEEAAAMLAPLLEQRRQRIGLDLPAETPAVAGDPAQLTQVFVNLLANAHKYAPEGSVIGVGGASAAGELTVWVEDEGPGVSAAESGSIFDRFARGETSAAAQDGMGLGLWIVKSLVERHGGRVAVGAGERGGARFTVTLPTAEASPEG